MEKNNKIEPKFKPCDCIINHNSGDMAIVKGVTKKGYYQFTAFYGHMFKKFKDVKNFNYDLQINYQKFYDLCTDEEKKKLDNMIEENKKKVDK